MNTILTPVDFSKEEEPILQLAASMARKSGATLILLHVLNDALFATSGFSFRSYYASYQSNQMENANLALNELAGQSTFEGLDVRPVVLADGADNTGRRIGEYADRHGVDLVLTFSKHRGGLAELFTGSQVTDIIRHTTMPVLCLSAAPPPALNRLLFATDFSPEANLIFPRLAFIARALELEIYCVKVNTPGDYFTDRLFQAATVDFAEECGQDICQNVARFLMYNDQDIVQGIRHCAADYEADIIATATHARSGLALLMSGSVTRELLESSSMPLLIAHLPKED